MTIDELRKFLDGVVQARRGDAQVLIWDQQSGTYVEIAQTVLGADGTVYIIGEVDG